MPNPWSPAQLQPYLSGRDRPDLRSTLRSVSVLLLFCALHTGGERGNYIQVHFAADVIQVHTAHTDTCGYAFALMLLLLFSFKVKYRPFLPSVTTPKQDYLLVKDHPNCSTMTTIHYKSHHKTHFQMHHLSFL